MDEADRERAKREHAVAQARWSSELEGARSIEEARADQDAYIRGEIDVDELVHRARSRHGLT